MPTSVANDRAVFGTACASASCFSPQIDWGQMRVSVSIVRMR